MNRLFRSLLTPPCLLLGVLLLYGCQTAAPRATDPTGAAATATTPGPAAAADTSAVLGAVLAGEAGDHAEAIRQFEAHLKTQGELPEPAAYDYGLALSRSGRYDEAIAQFDHYLETVGRHGRNFYPALEERSRAAQLKQTAAEQQARDAAVKAASSQLGTAPQSAWQQVQAQLATRAPVITEPLTGMELLLVRGGCYQMGDFSGTGNEDERPAHQVCVDDFYLGKTEVTQSQWVKMMGSNPAEFKGDDLPVETISWDEATRFASLISGPAGKYRLPTEAEWEYAARSGGKQEKYSGGNDPEAVAWHEENSGGATHPVATKQPNGLGFYDMSGNVYEWCQDKEIVIISESLNEQNLIEKVTEEQSVRRGGGWDSRIAYQQTGYRRTSHASHYRSDDTGFRIALPVTP